MASEAVRYIDGKPALEDGLLVDDMLLMCSECDAEYKVHYSAGETAWLDELRLQANDSINAAHPNHLPTIALVHPGGLPRRARK